MKKVKTYKLLSNTIRIEFLDNVKDDDGNWIFGQVVYCGNKAVMQVSTKYSSGEDIEEAEIENTVRHELFHFILDTLYFKEESQNETLVEWLANATSELHKQGLSI